MLMSRKPWQYNPPDDTALILDGCQLGLEVDGRCNMILCKFRCKKSQAPDEPIELKIMCPRERTYKPK